MSKVKNSENVPIEEEKRERELLMDERCLPAATFANHPVKHSSIHSF